MLTLPDRTYRADEPGRHNFMIKPLETRCLHTHLFLHLPSLPTMIAQPYNSAEEEEPYETYYWESRSDRWIELYESMLEQDWLNEPLRDLLETRVETLK